MDCIRGPREAVFVARADVRDVDVEVLRVRDAHVGVDGCVNVAQATQSTLMSTHSALEAAPQLVSVLSAQRPAIMPPFSKVASATEVASCLVPSDLAAKAAQGAVWPIQCRCGTRSGGRRWCPCGRHSCSRLCAPRRARANLAFGRSSAGRRRACRWRHAGSSRTMATRWQLTHH